MRLAFRLLLLFVPLVAAAQTNVDRLVKTLDSLTLSSFDEWKVSPDLKSFKPAGDPTMPGYDDSSWETLRLNQSITHDSCWIRKEIVLPVKLLGTPISGPMKLLLSVDDYGYLWVNGAGKGRFPWDGEFEITANAKPGERFTIAIKAVNTGGPLRLIRAQIASDELKALRAMIEDFSMSLRVAQKLLSFDTYQTSSNRRTDPGTDRSKVDRAEKLRLGGQLQALAASVDLRPLVHGPLESFQASMADVRAKLKPMDAYAKRFTLTFTANAHIDAAWLWRLNETIEVCKNTFASVLNLFNAHPDMTYTQSSAVYYDWMERLYPELFNRMKERIKDGRWELIGGMWIEPDCNLISGESWARHLLYAKRYFRQKFGVDVKIGWNPDSFGYNWNMPQFYTNAGIDAFITQKIGWNDTNVFPYRMFWWEGPDGSRVLSYFPFDYVNEVKNGYQLVDWLRQFEANTGMTDMMVLFGVGDHGGGPSLEMLERIGRLKSLDVFPNVRFGTAASYLQGVKQQDLSTLPVWKDELYLEYHQGTFTTQANMKKNNRAAEVLLTNAEKFSTLASLSGGPYNGAALETAWKNAIFNQFHDILPGSSIREVYIDATETHQKGAEIGTYELSKSLQFLTKQINTSAIRGATPVIIFNPLSWVRTDVARVSLPKGDESEYAVFDESNKEIPSQIVRKGEYDRDVLFIARYVPSMGYKTYQLKQHRSMKAATGLIVTPEKLENEFFVVSLDPGTGWVRSITDKRPGREVLKGDGNKLQLLADYPSAWDAWNVGLTGVEYPSTFRKIEIVERGPVRIVLRVSRDFLKPGVKKDFPAEGFPSSFFIQDVVLYDGIDRIDFKTDVDWWEEKTFLKVAFPLAVQDTVATYEIPYGTIQRSTQLRDSWEKAKVEVPARTWADVSQSDFGVSLVNNSKYGYDIKGNVMRLSLLRSPKWPDPTADRGKHSIEYALYPHAGTWREAKTVQRGYEFNYPFIAVLTDVHKGAFPMQQSFVQLSPSNLVLTGLKKAEEGDGWNIQWYDAKGEDTEAVLTLPRTPTKAVLSNFLEENGTSLPIADKSVRVKTKRSSVVTLKVQF